ncbi:MAG TPA: hypothetical protein VJ010_10420 [Actinomycetota bacterium]|nr:hypothetical protein [Actinomycetota bacterium]
MNPFDGSRDGMDQVGHLSDADLDRLMAGEAHSDARDAEALAAFFHEVKSRYVTQPSPATRQDHLSQIVASAQLNARRTQPSPQAGTTASPLVPTGIEASPTGSPAEASGRPGAPTSAPTGDPGGDRGRKPRWRKRLVFGSIFGGSITAKVAIIGVVAATAATGGLAAAGSLPRSLQSAVAGAAGNVGVRLPNPQATAQADAQEQAGKVASTVESLVQQVATAAERPATLTTSTVASTRACTQNVSAIASQLLDSAAAAGGPALVQSLAERATALAKESVGCALPAIAATTPASPPASTKGTDSDTARDAAAAKAISGAVQGCAAPLKLAIEKLVQAAIMARNSAQLQALAEDAKAVVTAARGCAQQVGSALQGALSNVPSVPEPETGTGHTPAPTSSASATTGTSGNGLNGFLNLVPNLPRGLPTVAPTPVPSIPKGTSTASPAPWWTQFLPQIPIQSPQPGPALSATPPSPSPSSGSWSGLTGSWNGSGSWSPYPSAPASPRAQQQDQHQIGHR